MEHASYSFEAFARALVYIPAILLLGSISYRWVYVETNPEEKWLGRLAFQAASALVLAIASARSRMTTLHSAKTLGLGKVSA